MSARGEFLHHDAAKWLKDASLIDIETVLRACAVELADRAIPNTGSLFAFIRIVEQVRLATRPRNNFD